MPTLSFLLKCAENFLRQRGIAQARSEAEWILAHLLHCRRCDLHAHLGKKMERAVLSSFISFIRRRGHREPLQYILGESDFYNISLRNDRRALIPRPETEELLEWIVTTWKNQPPKRILDLGTGSGAIGIALAKAFFKSEVIAIDIDSDALDLAMENAERNHVHNIAFVQSHWFENVCGCFDLIVANPPYLTATEIQNADPEVRDYEPIKALYAEQEGMADLLQILKTAPKFLNPSASLIMEMGLEHGNLLKTEALRLGFHSVQIRRDLSDRPRFFVASDYDTLGL
ncbi:MAG: peptide chain release factor N(5)-glutamine methyltransferase [Puniceicoccales bacterium]|jgi:release factor glutamine methyltransferase|nr:peptide chain release factor N(5)-glutamine methyltransferase [Puniceicoccales bacterium]